MFDYGLKEHEKRDSEVKQFWECVEDAKQENKNLGMYAITDFMVVKKRVR